ncbi:MAG TPA: hypothetical protein VN086_01755 [Candidatus Paceibacterota bacterium]|nr:hypothetical protein [Candidatus Paceibacterota bacterium]
MEQDFSPTPVQAKRSTPWGTIIGIMLILAIVVAGAYYSFTKRYQPTHQATTTAQS